jgi:hypothetical protein
MSIVFKNNSRSESKLTNSSILMALKCLHRILQQDLPNHEAVETYTNNAQNSAALKQVFLVVTRSQCYLLLLFTIKESS